MKQILTNGCPSKFAKGTKMIYSMPDEKDRQDVIAYLKTLPK